VNASIAGIPFDVNPKGVSWDYSVKTSSTKTVGGKVIQIYGVRMGDITVTGTFGKNGVERQRAFFKKISPIVDGQVPTFKNPAPASVPFLWPERGWAVNVFVKSLQQPGAGVSIQNTVQTVAPGFQMVLFPESGNSDVLAAVANSVQAKYLSRITDGLGWRSTGWNGNIAGADELASTLEGASIIQRIVDIHSGVVQGTPISPAVPTGNGG
jgi:hypothetical protein